MMKKEIKEKKTMEEKSMNEFFNIPINEITKSLNKINENNNISGQKPSNFIIPINNIKKFTKEVEMKKKEETDFTSKDYPIEDYDIYDEFEEMDEEEKKPIFNIPIEFMKKEKNN